jgi:hypothetical protein
MTLNRTELLSTVAILALSVVGGAVYIGNIEGRVTALEGDKDFRSILERKEIVLREIDQQAAQARAALQEIERIKDEIEELKITKQEQAAIVGQIDEATSNAMDTINAAAKEALVSLLQEQDSPESEVFLSVTGVPSNDALNLRQGPGSDYAIVATVPFNASGIVFLGQSTSNGADLWVRVRHGSSEGWANKRFLKGSLR